MIMNGNLKFVIYDYKVNKLVKIHKKHPIKLIWMLFMYLHTNERGIKNSPLIEITISIMY